MQADEQTIREQVTGYIDGVMSGEVVCGQMVRRAVERHLHDLEHGAARGLEFREDAAMMAIKFFPLLKHWKGEWAGKSFELQSWQMFPLWCVFGWMRNDPADGWVRRFRIAYNQLARKGGKTMLGAGVVCS